MDEVKIHTIHPVGGQRPAERPQGKPPAAGHKFEQDFQNAFAQMDGVSKNLNGTQPGGATADPKAIQDELRAATEHFEQLMRVRQNLAQLYLQIQQSDPEKS